MHTVQLANFLAVAVRVFSPAPSLRFDVDLSERRFFLAMRSLN
jgi:hypothetical protein